MTPDARVPHDAVDSLILSSLGSGTVAPDRAHGHLRAALDSRPAIAAAVGVLRARHSLSSQDAFALLCTTAEQKNVDLAVLAARITEGSRNGR